MMRHYIFYRFSSAKLLALASLFVSSIAFAADTANTHPTSPAPSAALGQIAYGLIIVLALMLGAAWLFKKINPTALGNKLPVKVVGGVSVGNRERVMVVEVADQWIVIGVTATQINALTTMQKINLSENEMMEDKVERLSGMPFSGWLKKTMENRQNSHE